MTTEDQRPISRDGGDGGREAGAALQATPTSYARIADVLGGVAHHLNNLLTTVILSADVALADGGPATEELEDIRESAEKAADLLRQLLAFGKLQVMSRDRLDLVQLVVSAVVLTRSMLQPHVSVRMETPSEPVLVQADRGALLQVLVNLVENARDSMADGGTVCLRLQRRRVAAGECRDGVPLTAGAYAVMCVEDEGEGMAPRVRARAFEPFFTTRTDPPGRGLGLSFAYGTVKQLGGYIFAESAPGVGTTIEIYLPVAGEGADVPPGGGETDGVPPGKREETDQPS